jgi:hypothetical protein
VDGVAFWRRLIQDLSMSQKYFYIQDTQRYDGNAIMLWCPSKRMYSSNVSDAAYYSEEEAAKIIGGRTTYVAVPLEDIKAAAIRVVMASDLRRMQEEKSEGRMPVELAPEAPKSS